ncbi:MAG: family 16 glycosylhydrolase [Firmicutes bacterium]|nr:family 16 glycosylhydrolase [Bacillota bacterium]
MLILPGCFKRSSGGNTASLSVRVIDRDSRDNVIATVEVFRNGTPVASSLGSSVGFTLTKGDYEVKVSDTGYETATYRVNLTATYTLTAELRAVNLLANEGFDAPLSSAVPDANGNLDTAGSWTFYLNSGGAGSAAIEEGAAKIGVTNTGSAAWAVQLMQAPVVVEKGAKYKITFAARASSAGMKVTIKVGGTGDRSWTAYFQGEKSLTAEWATYEATFTMGQDTDENARFEFWFLNTGTYYLDNIKFMKTGEEEIPMEGNKIEADEDAVENWQLVWSEEFNGPEVNREIWNFEIGNGHANGIPGWGNNELEYYTDGENASIVDGNLAIEARKETRTDQYGTYDYTSSRMTTKGKFEVKHGRIEVRAKLPEGKGIWPAIWMLGNDIGEVGWPACGEIDIMELVGHLPSTVYGTAHGPGGSVGSGYNLPAGKFSDDFHIFAIEWDADEIEWYVDGRLYHVLNKYEYGASSWVFDHPFFLILNVAVGGNWPGAPDETTVFPQRMIVDYIRVYRDTNPASIDGQEVWDCDYELTWTPPSPPPSGGLVTGDEDPEYYFVAEDPGKIDITIDWDNNAHNGTIMPDTWGSGTALNTSAAYLSKPCWEMTAGNGWGISAAVLAMMGDIYDTNKLAPFPADVSTYDSLEFVLATTGDFSDVKVKLAGVEKEISIAAYMTLTSTEWQTVSVPLSTFGAVDLAKTTQIAIFGLGGASGVSKLYVAEFYLKAN